MSVPACWKVWKVQEKESLEYLKTMCKPILCLAIYFMSRRPDQACGLGFKFQWPKFRDLQYINSVSQAIDDFMSCKLFS